MRIGFLSLLLLCGAALPAAAQPVPVTGPSATPPSRPPSSVPRDEIADLINRHLAAPGDEDEPDTAGQPRTAPEPEPSLPPNGPAPPTYTPAPRPQLDAPVRIEEAGKTPDAPPTVRDLAYDTRIRSSFASAESFQGPFDGGWTLSADGQDLYALQLVDRRDRLEGVWRDVRRKGSITASGLVDDMQRQGPDLILHFTPTPGMQTIAATLHDASGGRWTGELVEAGRRRTVALRRTGP
jgi:hypothetical protein